MIKKHFKKILAWIKANKTEVFIILAIFLIAAFVRLYKIDSYMTFLGDEGRDALIVKRILTTGDIPLIGPPTSVGNMYLGPLYYYMMAVPMTIFWLNPVAAAVQVALIGTATVGLIYFLSREWFGRLAAITASILYAFSPVNIIYSRSSWNPNPAPFFALLFILGFYKAFKTKNYLWFCLSGIAAAFAVQMHYLALIILPVGFILWLFQAFEQKRKRNGKKFLLGTTLAVVLFLILMSPLFIFDLKHNFMNYRALTTFFSNRETTVNLNILNTLERYPLIYIDSLVGRYVIGDNQTFKNIVSLLLFLPLFVSIYIWKKSKKVRWGVFALYIWLFIGVSGLVLYKQTVYDHYIGFLNPVPFMLIGAITTVLTVLRKEHLKIVRNLFLILVVIILVGEITRSPLLNSPNNQLKRTQEATKFVIEQAGGKPFNFALLAEHNYDAAYQFYLDVYGFKPKVLPFEKTDQLFVICEDKICNPVGNAKHEIAAFGWTKIEYEKEFKGLKIFKLVHNPEEEKNR